VRCAYPLRCQDIRSDQGCHEKSVTVEVQAARNRLIPSFQLGQQLWSLGPGSSLPHDLAPADRLALALRLSGRPVRQQVLNIKRPGVGVVGIQRMNQRRSFLDDPHPDMSMAVDPTLMPLGQPEPTLQIQVVLHIVHRVAAGEEAGPEVPHHAGHLLVDRIVVPPEARENRVEVGPTPIGSALGGGQSRGDFPDRLDVAPDRLLLGLHQFQALIDPGGQSAQLRLGEPPFFASRFRPIDCRTSSNASAILNPGG
jgi:hypothetical protein